MDVCTFFVQFGVTSRGMYEILWSAVFGFATLNILGLVARRFEPGRKRMTLGEILAIGVAVTSVLMLTWELLFWFHVLPIKLQPQ
jgi:CHASE2 domain-containing sensor protein